MKKGGYYFIEAMPVSGAYAEPGTAEPHKWTPYKLWAGDLWQCQGCGAQIVAGFGHQPIATQHEDDFLKCIDSFGARQLQVNDC